MNMQKSQNTQKNGQGGKTNKPTPEEIKLRTAQQWMPLCDVKDYAAYRKDQAILGFIRIHPKNVELLSKNEIRRLLQSNTEAFSAFDKHFQLYDIGRPTDLSGFLEGLMTIQKNEGNFLKKRFMNKVIQHNTFLASSGEVVERRCYFVIAIKDKTEKEAIHYLEDISKTFNAADLTTSVCVYADIMDLLLLFTHPTQAMVEKSSYDLGYAPIVEI